MEVVSFGGIIEGKEEGKGLRSDIERKTAVQKWGAREGEERKDGGTL